MGEIGEIRATLHRYAERAGRDPAEIEVAMKTPLYDTTIASGGPRRRFSGEPDQILQDVQTYADVGVGHIIFDIRGPDLNQALERLAWFSEEVMAHT